MRKLLCGLLLTVATLAHADFTATLPGYAFQSDWSPEPWCYPGAKKYTAIYNQGTTAICAFTWYNRAGYLETGRAPCSDANAMSALNGCAIFCTASCYPYQP